MRSRQSLKRKHCSLCASEVEIQVVQPEVIGDGDIEAAKADEPAVWFDTTTGQLGLGLNIFNIADDDVGDANDEEFQKAWNDVGEPVEKPNLRISDLIRQLQELKRSSGDLVLCVADANSLLTLSTDNLDLKVTSKRSYNFALGLNEENYLSVQIQ